ncbi:MAG: hypothetical protein IPM37_22955 [Hahellaceae bacterium]|nr:hypothetical protein [Hahellaceae bacterium]
MPTLDWMPALQRAAPGWQKVVQAAGRVIRNEHDRGVVILADQRFTQRDYATLSPALAANGMPARWMRSRHS